MAFLTESGCNKMHNCTLQRKKILLYFFFLKQFSNLIYLFIFPDLAQWKKKSFYLVLQRPHCLIVDMGKTHFCQVDVFYYILDNIEGVLDIYLKEHICSIFYSANTMIFYYVRALLALIGVQK